MPVRRLNPAAVWTLEISTAWLYDGRFSEIEIVIDEPRDYSAEEAKKHLEYVADQWEQTLTSAETSEPSVSPEIVAEWRSQIGAIRACANHIGAAGTRERAIVLEALGVVPGTIRLGAVEVLPDDLPSEWLEVFLGFALARKKLLSVREQKQLRKAAIGILMRWQASQYRTRELDERHAEQIVDRLSNLRRPLGARSVFAYLAKATVGRYGRG